MDPASFDTTTSAALAAWPLEWIVIAVIAAFFGLESFYSGSARTSTLAVALPLSLVVVQWLPNTIFLGTIIQQIDAPVPQAALFGIVFIILYMVLYRILFSYGSAGGSMLQSLLCGVAAAAIVMVVWMQAPGLDGLWHFSDPIRLVFGNSFAVFWLVAGYAAVAFARG